MIFTKNYAQIGIGTNAILPGVQLQVENSSKGVLLPRVSLTSTTSFSPITGTPANSLMVYNTNTAGTGSTAVSPGFYYWSTSGSNWVRIQQKSANETALFSNQNTSTNLNSSSGTFTDLFANVRFNSNPALYQKVDNTTLKINETGYYKITLNLDMISSASQNNLGIEILVNNVENIVSDNIYIPGRAMGSQPNSGSYITYFPINVAGTTLRIKSYQLRLSTPIYFRNANASTIAIEKIR
ncbi:hypothetical protein [Chryseobacterium wanjuense]